MDNNEASRKKFETHMISIGMATYLHYENDNQQYSNLPTQRLWKCWQSAQQQSAGEIKRLSLLRVKTLDELNQKLCNENDALKAENEKLEITLTSLRESLETIANESDPDLWQVKFAIEALYATNLEREK